MSIENIAELYQDFYTHVQTHIATHIAALQSKLSREAREKSPAPSTSSVSSAASRNGARRQQRGLGRDSEQQMLTASEVTDRRRARKQLELRRFWMEEAVERCVCERAYTQLWRHASADEGDRDAKLKSRAAALSVVGISLKELISTALSPQPGDKSTHGTGQGKVDPAHEQLAAARASLAHMNESKYPRAKLQALSTSHKEIVDALQRLFPSSSSADEILPTLIYAVITSHPESINIVSDLMFIQRFRNVSKLGGEAAYCLTNLEAAIGFLETVDLTSLRSGEVPEGPSKSATGETRPDTLSADKGPQDPLYKGLPGSPETRPRSAGTSASPRHSRRLSSLIGSRQQPIPGAVITQADNAIDAIHTAFDSSFQYLFGRIKEKQLIQSPGGPKSDIVAPKTLEDARKLVTEKPEPDVEEAVLTDPLSVDGASASSQNPSDLLSLIGGRRGPRDGSVSSTQSGEAATFRKSVATSSASNATASKADAASAANSGLPGPTATAVASGYAAVEQMRNFGDSLNPFKSFGMRSFGRVASPQNVPAASPPTSAPVKDAPEDSASAVPKQATAAASAATTAIEPPFDIKGIGPPIERFTQVKDARELNHFDVEALLRDYQRLASAVKMLQS